MTLDFDVAEREGFEPPIRLPVCRISSAVLSTTQPPLQAFANNSISSWRPELNWGVCYRFATFSRRRFIGSRSTRSTPGPLPILAAAAVTTLECRRLLEWLKREVPRRMPITSHGPPTRAVSPSPHARSDGARDFYGPIRRRAGAKSRCHAAMAVAD
jgi:hypothetical protein